jgi:hypothetical protein
MYALPDVVRFSTTRKEEIRTNRGVAISKHWCKKWIVNGTEDGHPFTGYVFAQQVRVIARCTTVAFKVQFQGYRE